MHLNRRQILTSLGGAALLAGAPALAAKDGPVTIVVPFPPGGTTDLLARVVAQELGQRLQRTVIVDNKPGAGGSLGAAYVARAKPDGSTLLMATVGTQSINPSLYKSLAYGSKDFTPISRVGNVSNVLVVSRKLPVNTVAELIAYGKANPGVLTFGSAGNGSSQHLTGEMFKLRAGVAMDHVPYRGSGPAMNDLIAGHIAMAFENLPTALPHIAAGKVRAIAVTASGRAQALPALPTIAQSGLKDFNASSWFGLLLPAQAPDAMAAQLHAAVAEIIAAPAVRQKLLDYGVEPITDASSAAFQNVIDTDAGKWATVIKSAAVVAD